MNGYHDRKSHLPRVFSAALLASFALLPATAARADAPPDLILTNGEIRTLSGWVQAIAIRQGIIIDLGSTQSVEKLRGAGTQVIDLSGSAVFPGLHDTHVHPLFAGLEQFTCGLAPGAAPKAIAATIRACAANKREGEWILGGNWVAAVFKFGEQGRAFLDAVAPQNPVLLNDEAHHSIWVNSLALKLAGVSRDTPNPANGIVERDARGEPTGLLRETATDLVERIVPSPSMELRRKALILAANQMLSYGITSFTVASVRVPDLEPLSALSGEGLIKQRVRGCIVWAPGDDQPDRDGEALIAARAFYTRPRFAPDCVKIFLDGVPTESHTGAMLAPYADTAGSGKAAPARGILNIPQDVLNEAVTRFDRSGLHVKFHAAGDAAVREAINAVASAREANGMGGPIHDVGHSTFVDVADIPRTRAINMAWEFSPYIWYPTPMVAKDITDAVGAERMKRWMPIREAIATGALVTVGSDWSVVPSVNPWLAIETLVTRQMPGGSDVAAGEQEKISLNDALRLYTENGAALMAQRDKVGAIEIGMHADLVVTETNPFKMPITQVHTTKVKMTFIDGEKVFDASAPPQLTAQ